MVSLEHAVIARINKKGERFEVLVEPDLALELRKGKEVDVEKVLAVPEVFKDARTGERASREKIEEVFGKKNVQEVAREIILQGEIQVTVEQRRRMIEERKREIASIISRNAVDPKTKLPHPQQRILNAMEQARVNVDPFKKAREQVNTVIESISSILPLSIEKMEVAIRVPVEYGGRVSGEIRKLGNVKSEEWKENYYFALVEIPAGLQTELYNKLNSLTHGNVDTKVVKEINV